jgi:hypothetical protein
LVGSQHCRLEQLASVSHATRKFILPGGTVGQNRLFRIRNDI